MSRLRQGRGPALLALRSKVVSLCFRVCRCWRTRLRDPRAAVRSTGDRPLRGQGQAGSRHLRWPDFAAEEPGPPTRVRALRPLHWAGTWGETEEPRWVQVRCVSGSPAFILSPQERGELTGSFKRHDKDICRGEVPGNYIRRRKSCFCFEWRSELVPIYMQMAAPRAETTDAPVCGPGAPDGRRGHAGGRGDISSRTPGVPAPDSPRVRLQLQ